MRSVLCSCCMSMSISMIFVHHQTNYSRILLRQRTLYNSLQHWIADLLGKHEFSHTSTSSLCGVHRCVVIACLKHNRDSLVAVQPSLHNITPDGANSSAVLLFESLGLTTKSRICAWCHVLLTYRRSIQGLAELRIWFYALCQGSAAAASAYSK